MKVEAMNAVRFGAVRLGAAALLVLSAACEPSAAGGNAAEHEAAAENAASAAAPSAAPVSVASGPVQCPATLSSATAIPSGGRVLGEPPGAAIPLSMASLTVYAPAAISADTSGFAEIEPEDGPERPDVSTQFYSVDPKADDPFALVCRYGASKPPLSAQTVLFVPIPPRGGFYRCTTQQPLGSNPAPVRAWCEAE